MGSLQMSVSKIQVNKDPLAEATTQGNTIACDIPLLNYHYYKIRSIFNHWNFCSYSGFWTSIWTSFGACVRTAMDFLSQLKSFLTLRPHKNSAPSKEKPCWRLTEIVSQVSETVSYLSIISTSFS
mgnify:CR=1 FL=1